MFCILELKSRYTTLAFFCHNMRLLTSRVALFTIAAVCVQLRSATGSSVVVLGGPSGVFRSPGYPDLDDNKDRSWNISLAQFHRITITFLDFDLLEVFYCGDKVVIYDGNVKLGPYKGTSLQHETITSASSTMLIELDACWPSGLADRRGIHVSYLTVYPSTSTYQTSKKITTTHPTTTGTTTTTTVEPVESTIKATFSSQRNSMLSNVSTPTLLPSTKLYTILPSSAKNIDHDKGSIKFPVFLLAGLLASIFIIIIVITLMVKRKKTKPPPNTTKTTDGNSEANHVQADMSIVVTERNTVDSCHLEYDYAQDTDIQSTGNENVCLDQNRVIFSTKMSSPRLQKKQPKLDTSKDLCVYENNASTIYDNMDFDEDYGSVGCSIQQTSPRVHKNDRKIQPKDSFSNLDEGIVINTVYEPYLPRKED